MICSKDISAKIAVEKGSPVIFMAKEYDNNTYIFAVNTQRQKGKIKFEVDGLYKGTKIEVEGENRDIPSQDGYFEDNFTDLTTHIDMIPR